MIFSFANSFTSLHFLKMGQLKKNYGQPLPQHKIVKCMLISDLKNHFW